MVAPGEALSAIGLLPDVEIDPAMAALQLARLDRPEADWQAASAHLTVLARESAAIGAVMRGRSGEARIGALAGLLHGLHGYDGDSDQYDDLANANMIQVVERRRGLPVSLGILWLHCIRAAGWEGHGIDFPGHFLIALLSQGRREAGQPARQPRRLLVDPFGQGVVVGTPRMLSMLDTMGLGQEGLEPGVTRPMSTRDVLLRLQRNLVQRRLVANEVAAALGSLEGMLLIAPDVVGNWLDAAELNRLLGRAAQAADCLERVMEIAPGSDAARIAHARLADLDKPDGP